jgi:hypothetical protein
MGDVTLAQSWSVGSTLSQSFELTANGSPTTASYRKLVVYYGHWAVDVEQDGAQTGTDVQVLPLIETERRRPNARGESIVSGEANCSI